MYVTYESNEAGKVECGDFVPCMNPIFDWISYEFNPRTVPAFLEKRRIQASIEMPRKYHHIVPRTAHTMNAKAVCARPTTPKLMPKVMKEARAEIGKSVIQTIVIKSSLPG